jgi:hypothetical protein
VKTPGVCELLGLATFTPHDLRRTAATMCGELGLSESSIALCPDRQANKERPWIEHCADLVRLPFAARLADFRCDSGTASHFQLSPTISLALRAQWEVTGCLCVPRAQPSEAAMEDYVNHENIRRYRKLIAISEGDPARDESRHQTLVLLLAEEEAKHTKPEDWPSAV